MNHCRINTMAETNNHQVSNLKGSHKKSMKIRQVQNKYDKTPSPQWQQLHVHSYCKNPIAIEVHVNPVGSATCSETHTSVESTIKEVNVTKPNSTECSEKQMIILWNLKNVMLATNEGTWQV